VFIDVPIEVAEKRDPKGLYKKARDGVIKEFTGVSAPYEAPENPDIHIRADKTSVEESVRQIIEEIQRRGLLSTDSVNGS
jgi:adenylylsulfate kinase